VAAVHPHITTRFGRWAFGVTLALGCLSVGRIGAAAQAPATPAAAVPADPDVAHDLDTLRGLWGGRYRLTPGDVMQLTFPYVSEFDQTVSVQPDGYVSLRGADELHVAGRTVPEVRAAVLDVYAATLRDPVVTVVLKEFEKPYFVAAGEVAHPGRYELRGATTLTQALAYSGGATHAGKQSTVLLFRRYGNDLVDVKTIDVKKMFSSRNLTEDPIIRPGDTVFVPKSRMSSISPYIPKPGLGFFANPF
jgi:polysaccharide biosynthesis/export protein